ncbi:Uncharacterized protein DAT39_013960 [Clarias magur]|uniref:Uncharacterized protein n=1 Tax=Clarias magur TaxID=1594786 RepID=A0A8J4UF62_CLAMG|nr:Uncharacterized protein DAT39_013960 [Clarias magur]
MRQKGEKWFERQRKLREVNQTCEGPRVYALQIHCSVKIFVCHHSQKPVLVFSF